MSVETTFKIHFQVWFSNEIMFLSIEAQIREKGFETGTETVLLCCRRAIIYFCVILWDTERPQHKSKNNTVQSLFKFV